MIRRFHVEHTPEGRLRAQEDVQRWGYPRPLDHLDRSKEAIWHRLGPDVVFWAILDADGDMVFHLCLSPEARTQHHNAGGARKLFAAWNFIAEICGARRILANCENLPRVQSYLTRLGYVPALDLEPGWMEVRLDEQAEDAQADRPDPGGAGREAASG